MLRVPVHSVSWIVCACRLVWLLELASISKAPRKSSSGGSLVVCQMFLLVSVGEERLGSAALCELCAPDVPASRARRKREVRDAKCDSKEIGDLSIKLPETHVQLLSGLGGT